MNYNDDHPAKESHTILSLLPYADNAQAISKQQKLDELKLVQKVTKLAVLSLQTFLNGDLISFDAQVGENLCQIRAYYILNLAQKWLNKQEIKNNFEKKIRELTAYKVHVKKVIGEWEKALKLAKSFNKNLDGAENISDFFGRHQLLIELNEELVFIIACYFLTHFNITDNSIPVAINLSKIALEFNVSKHKAKRLSHCYQQLVCQLGSQFIMTIANDLPEEECYKEILPRLYKIADEDRAVLPCFIVSKIIFSHALLKNMPVLFKINRFNSTGSTHHDTLLFKLVAKEDKTQFQLTPCDRFSREQCLIVSGEMQDKENAPSEDNRSLIGRILEETSLKLILANTAIHPQYSGKRLEALKDNPFRAMLEDSMQPYISRHKKELLLMQKYAVNTGCSKTNPTTFFLKHIYANTLFNEIHKLQSKYTGCAYKVIENTRFKEMAGLIYDKKKSISMLA